MSPSPLVGLSFSQSVRSALSALWRGSLSGRELGYLCSVVAVICAILSHFTQNVNGLPSLSTKKHINVENNAKGSGLPALSLSCPLHNRNL